MIHIYISVKGDLGPTIPISYVKPNCGKEESPFANQYQPFRNKVLSTSRKALIFFYVPVGLLFLGNVILFVLTFIKLSKYQKILDLRRLKKNEESVCRDRKLVRCYTRTAIVYLIIFTLMALNWSMELLGSLFSKDIRELSLISLMNTLQGVIVFYSLVIPQRDFVWHRIQQLRGNETTPPQVGNTELSMLNSDTTN
ncbi:putative G-protein coupled receptor Mth-like 2 isoform X2 [Lasioglossum baleicum]|uniref:putative G-protein coupled receptor Mth-like 2 isoform X2 n=1 Tax=Lasioglossum baleicum TaxID=434251 RepID=UPI003FCC56D9